jgi:hypothetical protein
MLPLLLLSSLLVSDCIIALKSNSAFSLEIADKVNAKKDMSNQPYKKIMVVVNDGVPATTVSIQRYNIS